MFKFKKYELHNKDYPYIYFSILYLYFIIFAFSVNTPQEIYNGLINIVSTPDILLSDYIAIGGLGAGIFNSALAGIYVLITFRLNDVKLNGSLIMTLLIVTGFAFFGKNILNMSPIMLGGYIYAKVKRDNFSKYLLTSFLATSLSPAVFQIAFILEDYSRITIALGILIGVAIGFLMPPIASNAMKSNGGYNLYNVGFSAGILAIIIYAILRSAGINFEVASFWSTEHTNALYLFIIPICLYFIVIGSIVGENNKENMSLIFKSSGKLLTDYFWVYKNTAFINAGLVGFLGIIVIFIIDAPLNGATLSGIFTMLAFGFLGKHIFNCIPVMLGAILTTTISIYTLDNKGIILGILFVTALAPIAGTFGFVPGLIAGGLHIILVVTLASQHAGLNLYNNGLSAGIVVMVLVPIFISFRKGDYN